jgi:hypothetical protein
MHSRFTNWTVDLCRIAATAVGITLAVPGFAATNTPAAPAIPAKTPNATVVAVQDAAATTSFIPEPSVVRRMVASGLLRLTETTNATQAWATIVKPSDVVGFKVTASPGPVSGTRPVVVEALIESLIEAGHPASKIVIWDKRSIDLRAAGWYRLASQLQVRCSASEDAGWEDSKFYDSPLLGRLVAGDHEFGKKDGEGVARKSFVTRLLTRDITRIISVAPVLSHHVTGVHGHLAGLAWAGVDNTIRFFNDPVRMAEAVPEICALDDLMPRVALAVGDALICQYRGEERTLLHYSEALNELRFSRDPVDIDRARTRAKIEGEKTFTTELYTNAELIELGIASLDRISVTHIP